MPKRRKRKVGICVYCGREAPLTNDHIPPKSLYPSALRSHLLLIPSCTACNCGASKDDEYLRTMIGLSVKGQGEEDLKAVSDATIRALVRPEAAGFRRSIAGGINETFVSSPAGILMPALTGNIDLDRFDKVVARIIKGIFFTERGIRLPSEYAVVNYSLAGLQRVRVEVGRQLQRMIEPIIAHEPKHIGGTQFVYWAIYNQEDPNLSMWVIVIHRHHFFIGWTMKTVNAKVCGDQGEVKTADKPEDREEMAARPHSL